MIGVITGDVIGSVHEHALTKSTDFPHHTEQYFLVRLPRDRIVFGDRVSDAHSLEGIIATRRWPAVNNFVCKGSWAVSRENWKRDAQ
jgi:hypothetical protein